MWLLPSTPIELDIKPGILHAPWNLGDEALSRLAALLRASLALPAELHVDDATLDGMVSNGVTLGSTLVVVRCLSNAKALPHIIQQAKALSASMVLIRWPFPIEDSYAWVERQVKVPLLRAIASQIANPTHPLAPVFVGRLPTYDAAAFTADPIELIELLEATFQHRLRNAQNGQSEAAYLHSLRVVAGSRLAIHLCEIAESLTGPDKVELSFLVGPKTSVPRGPLRDALHAHGLVHVFVGEGVRGPLLRSVFEPTIWGTFLRTMSYSEVPVAVPLAETFLARRFERKESLAGLLLSTPFPQLTALSTLLIAEHRETLKAAVSLLSPSEAVTDRALMVIEAIASNPGAGWSASDFIALLAPVTLDLQHRENTDSQAAGKRARGLAALLLALTWRVRPTAVDEFEGAIATLTGMKEQPSLLNTCCILAMLTAWHLVESAPEKAAHLLRRATGIVSTEELRRQVMAFLFGVGRIVEKAYDQPELSLDHNMAKESTGWLAALCMGLTLNCTTHDLREDRTLRSALSELEKREVAGAVVRPLSLLLRGAEMTEVELEIFRALWTDDASIPPPFRKAVRLCGLLGVLFHSDRMPEPRDVYRAARGATARQEKVPDEESDMAVGFARDSFSSKKQNRFDVIELLAQSEIARLDSCFDDSANWARDAKTRVPAESEEQWDKKARALADVLLNEALESLA